MNPMEIKFKLFNRVSKPFSISFSSTIFIIF